MKSSSGLKVRHDKGMRRPARRSKLRQEQRGDEKGMTRQLHDPYLSILIDTGNPERLLQNLFSISRVEAEVAPVLLASFLAPVCSGCGCAGQESQRARVAGYDTLEATDQQYGCLRRGLLVVSFPDAKNVPRILYQSMLEPTSGREKRPAPLSRKPDARQRPLHAPVRASG